ncbi:unnamed protein product [Spirodela intermedia]|uniref:Uncharacterized protein n=1 Tax=Spirodela intermedia TaxID=51605 RepID=A0A7I8K810_SPIIN|nr:unnamed protein product [Spirodela intermedia]
MEEGEIVISGDLSDGGTPSRYELLTMVKQHSKFLREGMIDEDDTSDVEMDVKFWYEMLDLYFIRGRESKGGHEDDLIFFVKDMNLHGYGFNDNVESAPPYFVRRWAAKLEKVAGENYAEVDWRRSFYLNFIAHTSFTVTVAICSIQDLKRHQSGADTPLSPVYKVVKTVYASPSRVNFQTNFRKEAETIPAYPNICFAINDFDDAFDSVVLSETDHCYCVLLNADGGAAFPTEGMHENSSGFCGSDNDSRKYTTSKLTLFSGFVSYPMVREAYEAGKSRFGSLWPIGNAQAKTDRLYMRGPGGRGEVEVAVSGVADQSQENSGPPSPLQLSKEGFGIGLGSIVRRAASAASEAAKQAYAAASATIKTDAELLPLKCCLMSVALPWENIAHDLLFKASPPVKL